MNAKHYGVVLRDILEVILEPLPLIVRKTALVAGGIRSFEVLHVLHTDNVDLGPVERKVDRPEALLEGTLGLEI